MQPWSTALRLQFPASPGVRAYFAEAAGTAARFLAKPDGPRVGAVGFIGWDTHINEGAASGQLANLLGALDGALAAIETNMGDAWRETVVAVITEFGRTARINGTNGTDHGTGTVAFLAGGALRGGRVIADWPGLKQAQLYRGTRPQAHHRSARRAQGPAPRSSESRRACARQHRVSRQHRRRADGGSGWLVEEVSHEVTGHYLVARRFRHRLVVRSHDRIRQQDERQMLPVVSMAGALYLSRRRLLIRIRRMRRCSECLAIPHTSPAL